MIRRTHAHTRVRTHEMKLFPRWGCRQHSSQPQSAIIIQWYVSPLKFQRVDEWKHPYFSALHVFSVCRVFCLTLPFGTNPLHPTITATVTVITPITVVAAIISSVITAVITKRQKHEQSTTQDWTTFPICAAYAHVSRSACIYTVISIDWYFYRSMRGLLD